MVFVEQTTHMKFCLVHMNAYTLSTAVSEYSTKYAKSSQIEFGAHQFKVSELVLSSDRSVA